MQNVYISGALTNLSNADETKRFYEAIAELCSRYSLTAYVPHLHTDPQLHPELTPQAIFNIDKARVTESDLVIAYVGRESFGVGMELAYAEERGIPVIVIYHKGQTLSRIVKGMPNLVGEIIGNDFSDALGKLAEYLELRLLTVVREIHIEVVPNGDLAKTLLVRDSAWTILLELSLPKTESKGIVEALSTVKQRGLLPSRVYIDQFSGYAKEVAQVWDQAQILNEYQ